MRPIALALLLLPAVSAAAEPLLGRVSVIDGDTVEFTRGSRVRLWGIDAPESSQTCTEVNGAPWRCGAAAANALSAFIGVRNVQCQSRGTDQYRRTVATCAVAGVDLGAWLVQSGWALPYERYSHGTYRPQERVAQTAHAGLHRGTFINPWDYRHAASHDRAQQ